MSHVRIVYGSAFQTFPPAEPFFELKYFLEPHPFLRTDNINQKKYMTRMSWNYACFFTKYLFQNVIHLFLNITLYS
jgi:hypothetical protein